MIPTAEEKKQVQVNFNNNEVELIIPDNLEKFTEYFKNDIQNMITNHGGLIIDYSQEKNKHIYKIK
jgi:hypothetical protein